MTFFCNAPSLRPAVSKSTKRQFLLLVFAGSVLCLFRTASLGQSVTLGWNPVSTAGIAGYRVYYGTSSGNLSSHVSTNSDVVTISGLQQGRTYYFAVTAYNSFGFEGPRSGEISYTVPYSLPSLSRPTPQSKTLLPVLSLTHVPATAFPKTFRTSCRGPMPASWLLEATTDMRTWKAVAAGTDPSARITMTVTPKPAMFFRLLSSSSGIHLQTQHIRTNSFPNSFSITTAEAPANWTLQASEDMKTWSTLETGTNTAVHAAVIVSTAPRMFFRLRGQ